MIEQCFKLIVLKTDTSVKVKLSDLKQDDFVFLVRCVKKFLNFFSVSQGEKVLKTTAVSAV